MSNRTPIGCTTEARSLVGVRANEANQKLREFDLPQLTWFTKVENVLRVSLVLGLDPPAVGLARPKASISISVAARPNVRRRDDNSLAVQADQLVVPLSIGPEICDYLAISPAECHKTSAQRMERDLPGTRAW